MFRRDTSANQFSLAQKLEPHDGHEYQYFGISVAMEESYCLVGAAGDDNHGVSAGAVFTYGFSAEFNTWHDMAVLYSPEANAYDNFGYAVAAYGKKAVVGAFGDWVSVSPLPPTD